MSSRTCRLIGLSGITLGLALLVLPVETLGQQPVPPIPVPIGGRIRVARPAAEPPKEFSDAVTLPTNRESKRLIQAAQDYIKKKEWRVACECLQALLEEKQDSFIEIDAPADDKGKSAKHRVSVRIEANRLIGELPADGLETYQVMYGQAAKDALQAALDTNDPALLADVALRYLHTKAGADATNLLGTYHLDGGRYLMAALSFERLLSRPDADKLPAKVLFKAALAFRRAGDSANAEKAWKKMAEKAGRGELVFGSRKLTLEQVRQEFERTAALIAQGGQTDWWVFRGNPARNAQGVGGTAYLEARWRYSMTPLDESDPNSTQEVRDATEQVRKLVASALARLDGKPILPAFFPIAADGKLIFRTYDGIHAVSLRDEDTADGKVKAGDLLWRTIPAQGSLHSMLSKPDKRMTVVEGWYNTYYSHQGMGPVGVMFENSTVGSLSHDGQRVYFIDDLTIPPHPNMVSNTNMAFGNHVHFGPFTDEVQFNRLTAVELKTGLLQWSIGERGTTAPNDKEEKKSSNVAGEELRDAFFLGPPLPLGGKLYLLVEKNTELKLVCLDPSKVVSYADNKRSPELVWQQSLGTANNRLPQDTLRRMQAAHLAYADGVLVCPTNAGVVLGVDLLSHSLVWAHSYRDGNQPQTAPEEVPIRGRFRGVTMGMSLSQERWRPSAPVIQNGKVVFTAFDGDGGALHCLNLRDGRLIWSLKRTDDDLYLGGVFGTRVLIVGKNSVRALNLDDGKELWKLGTGMPAGQGAAGDDIYYLPLQWAVDDSEKRPGVLAINLATGKAVGPPARPRKKEQTLGNLLFAEGELVSQTAQDVAAFPELKRMLAEIDRRLKQNPTDPIGLTERGELYLDKGDLPRAIEDLRTALAHKPPADVGGKAKTKLHEALTDLLLNNFPAAEKYLDEYRALCKVEVPDDAEPAQKQKLAEEQLRREVTYLSLLGRGRERQGRLLDAFNAYEQFGALTGNKELVSVIDEPNTKSRPDVWSRGRIKGMIEKATPEQRRELDEAIAKRWATVRDAGDLDAVRRFVSVFGTHSQVGREAQLQLAERLLAAGGADDLTEAETKLQGLCFAPDVRRQDPSSAARAVEAMIRVYLKRGLYEDAVGFYKQLGTEFANVPVRDGKTGADLLNELFTDKRFLPYLEPLGVQWKGAIRGQDTQGSFRDAQTSFTVEPEGDGLLPFFRRHRLVLDMAMAGTPSWTLRLLDRESGEEVWRQGGLRIAQYFASSQQPPRFAFASGHTLVLHLNDMVYAFDLAQHKPVWQYSLTRNALPANNTQMSLDKDGRVQALYQDGRTEKLGGVGLVTSSYVALLSKDGLVALDPNRPGPSKLWEKADVPLRAQLFGDDEHIYVVEPVNDSTANVRALRAQDGVTVPVPDFGRQFARRLRTYGRCLLLQEDDPKDGKVLRLYDVQTGQDLWRRTFHAGATVVQSRDPELTGVIDKDHAVTLLAARSGAVLFKSQIEPEHTEKLEDAALVSDRSHFYLALNRKPEPGVTWSPSVSHGIRSLKVNGPLYALNRTNGNVEWVCDFVPHQSLLLEQAQDLPVLLFAAQYYKSANGTDRTMVKVTAVDKRTGKLVYDKEFTQHAQFHALRVDQRGGVIELRRQDLKIELRAENGQAAMARPADVQAAGAIDPHFQGALRVQEENVINMKLKQAEDAALNKSRPKKDR